MSHTHLSVVCLDLSCSTPPDISEFLPRAPMGYNPLSTTQRCFKSHLGKQPHSQLVRTRKSPLRSFSIAEEVLASHFGHFSLPSAKHRTFCLRCKIPGTVKGRRGRGFFGFFLASSLGFNLFCSSRCQKKLHQQRGQVLTFGEFIRTCGFMGFVFFLFTCRRCSGENLIFVVVVFLVGMLFLKHVPSPREV